MEVDSPPSSDPTMEAALSELTQVLSELEMEPQNVPLLHKQIRLMRQLDMQAEVVDTIQKLSQLVMLSEELWSTYFDLLIPTQLSLELFVDTLEKFDQAEQDYLSITTLSRHLQFVLLCSRSAHSTTDTTVDDEIKAFLTEDTTRSILSAVCDKAAGLLSESHLVWQPWLEWEMEWLERIPDRQKQVDEINKIHSLFLDRAAVPHTTMDATSSAYSSFCSKYSPDDYEQRMIAFTQSSQDAKTKLSMERRYQQTREDLELQLAYPSAQTYLTYINWETDPKAKSSKPTSSKQPHADPFLIKSIFERAITFYARSASAAEASLILAETSLKTAEDAVPTRKGKARAKDIEAEGAVEVRREEKRAAAEMVKAYKEGEAGIWAKYIAWSDEDLRPRACRACPGSSAVWTSLLHEMEQSDASLEDLTGTFEKALSLGLLTADPTSLVDIFICRAAFENRAEPDVQGDYHPVMATLIRGIDLVAEVSKTGDPSFKLEKFMVDWAESKAPQLLQQAMGVLDKPSKSRSASYQLILLRTSVEARRDNVEIARDIFDKSIQRSDLDWPEAVYEAFIQFENVHGDLTTFLDAKKRVEKELERLSKRREKVAQEQMAAAALAYEAQPQAEYAAVVEAVPEATPAVNDVAPAVSVPAAAPAASADGGETHAKRDREHSTILVTGLPHGIDTAKIETVFSSYGAIRETVIITGSSSDAALVEFRHAESVPAALTRDGDDVDDRIIHVSLLWRSTLFVTNFPRDMDDTALKALFEPFGAVLQTRWPSRKYADNRRFCYVTMISPSAAEAALSLHGKQEAGFGLTVLISDPSAKTKRSDSVQSTLFVGGLTSKTTEQEVEELFKPYGSISSIKLGWDPIKKICKGFAFVEMASEDEAKATLVLGGTRVNGKILKVSISDPNHAAKKTTEPNAAGKIAAERRTRSVRLHHVPEGTQEGLLQQALEKIVPVKRLEMFADTHQALAELESVAEAGKLLLRTEPIILNGTTIIITAQNDLRGPPPDASTSTITPSAQPTTSLSFAPRAPKRKTLGKGRTAPVDKAIEKAVPVFVPSSSAAKGQDDFRALVDAKNKQREGNLIAKISNGVVGEKRGLEDGDEEREGKKSKIEENGA